MTILVRAASECDHCGQPGALDNEQTGKNAAKWRRAVNASQKVVAEKGMGITQSYYSALEVGERNWNAELIHKFEKWITPLLKEKNIDVETI